MGEVKEVKLEIGENLRDVLEKFIEVCEDRYNLGAKVQDAFGVNWTKILKDAGSLPEGDLVLTVHRDEK